MFRLVKLAMYGLAAYAAYEFISGMIEGPAPRSESAGGNDRGQGRRRSIPQTPAIKGRRVGTQDADGATTTPTVGRGVLQL